MKTTFKKTLKIYALLSITLLVADVIFGGIWLHWFAERSFLALFGFPVVAWMFIFTVGYVFGAPGVWLFNVTVGRMIERIQAE